MNAFISWSKKLFPKKENSATYKIVTTSKQNSLGKKAQKQLKSKTQAGRQFCNGWMLQVVDISLSMSSMVKSWLSLERKELECLFHKDNMIHKQRQGSSTLRATGTTE